MTVKTLRRFVSGNLTDEDVIIFGALEDRYMNKEEVYDIICNYNQWADEVEISVLVRCLPNIALIIVDEDRNCICKRGNDSAKHQAVLYLKCEHYYAVFETDSCLFGIMSDMEYLYVDMPEPEISNKVGNWTGVYVSILVIILAVCYYIEFMVK